MSAIRRYAKTKAVVEAIQYTKETVKEILEFCPRIGYIKASESLLFENWESGEIERVNLNSFIVYGNHAPYQTSAEFRIYDEQEFHETFQKLEGRTV